MITTGKCSDQILNSFRKCNEILEPLLQITRGTQTNPRELKQGRF